MHVSTLPKYVGTVSKTVTIAMQGTAKHVPLAIVSGSTMKGKQMISLEVQAICNKCHKIYSHDYDWEFNPIHSVVFAGDYEVYLCTTCKTPENIEEINAMFTSEEYYQPTYHCTYCDSRNEFSKYCNDCKAEYERRTGKKL